MKIPDVTGMIVPEAARAYIAAGFSVIPTRILPPDSIHPKGQKIPTLGWNQGITDPDDPRIGQCNGISIGMGVNGLVAFDVDFPDEVPTELRAALGTGAHQVTGRGHHYVFRTGMVWSSETGPAWGEVRGNGVIVVAPSPHPLGGQYLWEQTEIPPLPGTLETELKQAADVPKINLDTWITEHTGANEPGKLTELIAAIADGSRGSHGALTGPAGFALVDAVNVGQIAADAAVEALQQLSWNDPRDPEKGLGWTVGRAETVVFPTLNLWDKSDFFRTCHQAAKAREVSPNGMVGAALAHLAAAMPADLFIEDCGKGEGVTNLAIALMSTAAGDKSVTLDTAEEVFQVSNDYTISTAASGQAVSASYATMREATIPPAAVWLWKKDTAKAIIQSGRHFTVDEIVNVTRDTEAKNITAALAAMTEAGLLIAGVRDGNIGTWQISPDADKKRLHWFTHNVLFSWDEVDSFTAAAGRESSTLTSVIRTLVTGGALGEAKAEKKDGQGATGTIIPKKEYRGAVLIAAQYARFQEIIGETDGGTSQRMFLLPTGDTTWTHDVDEHVPMPEPMHISVTGHKRITVDPAVKRQIRQANRERNQRPARDGHLPYLRLKIAAILAVVGGTGHVTPEHWKITEQLAELHHAEQAKVDAVRARKKAESNTAAGEARAQQDHAAHDATVARYQAKLLARIQQQPFQLGKKQLTATSAAYRPMVREALTELVSSGRIVAVGGKYGLAGN